MIKGGGQGGLKRKITNPKYLWLEMLEPKSWTLNVTCTFRVRIRGMGIVVLRPR